MDKGNIIVTSAPGKVILFGEHAVVHYKLGIAASINKRAYVTVSSGNEEVTIESKNLNLKKSLSEEELLVLRSEIEKLKAKKDFEGIKEIDKDKLMPSFFVVAKLTEKFGFHGLRISIDSEVPKNLGSSASIFSAIVLGVSTLLGKKLSKEDISKIANEGDIVAHEGSPSGIDASTVTHGGYLQFKKIEETEALDIKPLHVDLEIPLVIVDSKEEARTGETVSYIRDDLKKKKPKLVKGVLERLDAIAHSGLEAMQSQNLEEIGKLMTDYYQGLKRLDISTWELKKLGISTTVKLATVKLDEIIKIALENHALGAKPTGGWGGGCCIALGKDKKQGKKLVAIFEKNGFKAFQTKLGVEGVRIEKEHKKGLE